MGHRYPAIEASLRQLAVGFSVGNVEIGDLVGALHRLHYAASQAHEAEGAAPAGDCRCNSVCPPHLNRAGARCAGHAEHGGAHYSSPAEYPGLPGSMWWNT